MPQQQLIKIDQSGLSAGQVGKSRTDGKLDGSLVTLTDSSAGATTQFRLLDVPVGDTTAVSTLAVTGNPKVWTFQPTANKPGTYYIERITDLGLPSEQRERRVFRVRTSGGLIIPAFNEDADETASLLNQNVADSVDNATDYTSDTALNTRAYTGWFRALHEIVMAIGGAAAIAVSSLSPGSIGQAVTTVAGPAVAWGKITPGAGIEPGTNGQALVTAGGVAAWGTIAAAGLTPGTPGQVLTSIAGPFSSWALIADVNVATNAGILGTKIVPDFGAQNVVSTGNLQIGTTPRGGTGIIRVPNNQTILTARSGDGLSDLPLIRTDAANIQYFGAGSSGSIVVIDGGLSAGVHLRTANANRLAINNGQMVVYVPIYFPGTITTPLLSITPEGGPGKQLTVRGQSGVNSGDNGSQLLLQGGSAVTTGLAGAIRMQLVRAADTTFETMVEVAELATSRRVLSLMRTSVISTTQMPANTGDCVVYLAQAATEPTANAVSGALLWTNSANVVRTNVGVGLGLGSIATAGLIRVPYASNVIYGRNQGNTADNLLLDWGNIGTSNNLRIGAGVTHTSIQGTSCSFSPTGTDVLVAGIVTVQLRSNVSLSWAGTSNSPFIFQSPDAGGSGGAQDMTIRAQTMTGNNRSGGFLIYQGGGAHGTGLRGGHRFQLNNADTTFETMLEVAEVATSRRVVSLAFGSNISTTQMLANTGDRVVFIGQAATEPTVSAVSGALLWTNSANVLRTNVGIGLGLGSLAQSGFIRLPNGVQTLVALRNDGNTADHRLIRSDTTLGSTTITFGESSPNPVTSWDFHSTVRFNHGGVQMATIGSGGVVVNQVGLNFSKTYTTGSGATIFQQDIDTGSTINDMVILAQGSVVAASNHNGGRLLLAGGKPTGTGLPGRTQLSLQRAINTYEAMLEVVELAASRRVVAIGMGTSGGITTTQMPVNTGDRVVYLAQAATEPTANAVGGALVWANSSNVLRTNVAIGIGFNAATHGMLRVPHNQVIFGGRNVTNTGNVTLIDWGVAGDSVLRIGNEIDTLRVGLTGGYRWDFGGATVEIRGGNGVLRWVDYEGAEIGPGGMNYTGGAFSGIGKGWFIQAQVGGAGSGFAGGGITLSAGSGGDNTASGGNVQINAGKAGGTGFGGGVHGRVEINCGTYDVGGGRCFSAWDSGTTGPAIRFYNHSGNHAPRATITGSRSGATVSVLQQLLVALGDLNGVNLVRDLTSA